MQDDLTSKSKDELIAELRALRPQVGPAPTTNTAGETPLELAAQARLAAIVESSDDAIVSKTLDGIIRTWNKGAERIFGYTAEEIIGRPINVLIPSDRQHEEPQIIARLRSGQRVDHFETVRITKDGKLLDVSVTISPVRADDGQIIGASKIARDITKQKSFERELRAAKEMAESANRAKDLFLSSLSHELRTPLTPVLAEMSLLEAQSTLSDELRGRIGMMRRNVETEARLVDDLLDMTRISRGKILLHHEVVDAHEVIRGAVAVLQKQMDDKGAEIALGLRARQHHVWADAGRLEQVFINLLSNAIKFTPEQSGSIKVRTSNEQDSFRGVDRLRIEVIDNGVGIEPSLLPRLFTAFEQAESANRLGGLGLGLSISKSLIEMHNGTIRASSGGKGEGATFIVELEAVQPPAQADAPTPTGHAKSLDYRILLVEDHVDTRTVMQRLLQSFGCHVVAAGTVREAIALSDNEPFDLLISDIGLPDGTGTQVIQQIKSRRKIRGIALSGYGQEEDLLRSRAAGFDAHLTKPVNLQLLKDAIEKITH